MKNYTTPRTLADCTFTSGYAESPRPRSGTHPAEWVVLAILVGYILSIIFWS